jgi:hypothetical protein
MIIQLTEAPTQVRQVFLFDLISTEWHMAIAGKLSPIDMPIPHIPYRVKDILLQICQRRGVFDVLVSNGLKNQAKALT